MSGSWTLPLRWRPRRGRLVPHILAAASLAAVAVIALVAPTFQPADRVALIILGGAVAIALFFFGRCELRAGPAGLTVVNVLRVTELEWAQVIDARMEPGEPWPTLDLADGTTIAAMGIQSADGESARRAVTELRALIAQRGETAEPRRRGR
jgi:PH (Pleckstrin Homology) domain-containing protein